MRFVDVREGARLVPLCARFPAYAFNGLPIGAVQVLERENALKVSVLFRKLRPPLEPGGFAALVAPLVSFCAIHKRKYLAQFFLCRVV